MATFNQDGKSIVPYTNDTSVVWSTDCGTLYTDAAGTTAYTGTSRTSVYLKADNQTKNGTLNAGATTHTIQITGVIPFSPNYEYTWKPTKRGVIYQTKRDGSINGRILGGGSLVRDYRLLFRNRR